VGLALGPSLVGIALAVGGQASVAIPPFIAIVPAVLMLAALVPLYLSRFPSVSPTQSLHAHQ
jgi:hypothetical protein